MRLVREQLATQKLMQLATSANDQPWLCSVWFAHDDDLNIYFMSRQTRRHSEEIAANESVACTFIKDYQEGFGEAGKAVQMAGKAVLVVGEDNKIVYEKYSARFPKLKKVQAADAFVAGEGPHFFYKVKPTEIIYFNDQDFPTNPRQVAFKTKE